jgi:diguanylate cyclase (GGDEF)-like protein
MKLSKTFKLATFGTLFLTITVFFIQNAIKNYLLYKEEVKKATNRYILIEKKRLKEKVDLLSEEFEYILNNLDKNVSKKFKIKHFIKILQNYNQNHKKEYIFMDSETGGILVHIDKKLIGVNYLKSKNEKLRKLKEKLIIVSHSKNHFINYVWTNPKTHENELKITYIKHIKNSPYFLGSGIYITQIEKIKKQIKQKYLNEFLKSMILYAILSLLLAIILYYLLKNLNQKLENDLKIFDKFIKEEKIEKNKLYFNEFKNLASKIVSILQEKNKLLKELEHKTYYDLLTNLPNKIKLEEDLKKFSPTTACIIDIKHFSLINEYYSSEVGDLLLKEFSKKLKKLIYRDCKLYRYSSDEFIILNFTENYKEAINKINNYFKKEIIKINYKNETLPINIDLVIATAKSNNSQDLIKKLQLALLYAKKNNLEVVEYNEQMDVEDEIIKKFEAIELVKKALKEDRIIPVFQKILKPNNISYECLVRIKEKDKLISPFFFLDDIKNTALYYNITKTMIKKSCEIFKNRSEDFSLNFSYKDLKNEEIKKYLVDCIKKYNLKNRIIIELLETESMEDFKEIIKFIEEMKPYGIKIAIDDFGTGYSNFSYLTEIQPQYIKIDGSLIKTIDKNQKHFTIVKHINTFAHDLGIQTIAEFVHNESVYNVLKNLGIDAFQGYYIDEPKEII